MKAGWFPSFVIGAVFSALATYVYSRTERAAPQTATLILTYSKPTGLDTSEFRGKVDPGKGSEVFAIEMARKCGVNNFTTENNMNVTDVNQTMFIRMPLAEISDVQFRCLSDYVAPPYVRLKLERKN